jgi:hypothetical protein
MSSAVSHALSAARGSSPAPQQSCRRAGQIRRTGQPWVRQNLKACAAIIVSIA